MHDANRIVQMAEPSAPLVVVAAVAELAGYEGELLGAAGWMPHSQVAQ